MEAAVHNEEWMEAQITRKENEFFQQIIDCQSPESVEAALTFAAYINTLGLTPENYPVFLRMLEIENRWVVDALIGEMDPFELLTTVQPNHHIVSRIFAMMTRWNRGGIYSKNLSVILGVLKANFTSPEDGFRIYPLSISDINGMGKHLDKSKSQDDPLNRAILNILDSISHLKADPDSPTKEKIALQASAIRNAFFDDRKSMEEVIPAVLLEPESKRKPESTPRKRATIDAIKKKEKDEKAKAKAKAK
jgi:hypothetical protein